MASPINKETLRHLAALARIELHETEEEKLLYDMQNILGHFDELKEIASGSTALSYSTTLQNVFREDEERSQTNHGAGIDQFPEDEKGFLNVPPVFSSEGGSASGGT